jgi:hypothetical protein
MYIHMCISIRYKIIQYDKICVCRPSDLQPVTLGIFDKILGGFNQQIMGLSTWEYLGYRTEDLTHEAFQGDFTRKNWSRNRPKFVIQYIQWVYVL